MRRYWVIAVIKVNELGFITTIYDRSFSSAIHCLRVPRSTCNDATDVTRFTNQHRAFKAKKGTIIPIDYYRTRGADTEV